MIFLRNILFAFVILCSLLCSRIYGQERLAIGDWADLLPYYPAFAITQNDTYIFYACQGGIFRISKQDLSTSIIDKSDGLSDISVRHLIYDEARASLIAVYDDANIDVITNDGVININDIAMNTNILSEKEVFDVFIHENILFIAADFGLVELDLSTLLFGNTTFTPDPVLSVWADRDVIRIGTSQTSYYVGREKNTADFSLWNRLSISGSDMEPNLPITAIVSWKDRTLFLSEGALFEEQNDTIIAVTDLTPSSGLNNLLVQQKHLILIQECFRCGDAVYLYSPDGEYRIVNTGCVQEVYDLLIETDQDRIWVLDRLGDYSYFEADGSCHSISTNRPEAPDAFELYVQDKEIVIATGLVSQTFGNTFSSRGVYYRIDDEWGTLNRFNTPFLEDADLRDVIAVDYDDDKDTYYFASYWAGVLKWSPRDSILHIYNQNNSPLTPSSRDQRIRISDVALDADNNLWVTNYETTRTLNVLTDEGDWYTFSIPFGDVPQKLAITDQGIIYISMRNIGVVAYHPGENLASTGDDLWRRLPIADDGIPTNQIIELAVDLDDNLWIGTQEGASIVNCTRELDCQIVRPIVEPSYLLQNERVTAIAIDGANRKWFGTENGLFLQSADGREEISRFTEENSPLISNQIRDLTIDPTSGILYIATADGICTFRSDATEGSRFHNKNEVIVYPNPVRGEYSGPIAIKNLTENAYVKITTISGQLVHEGRSTGGQYIWFGTDQDGKDVAPGVYLVYALNDRAISTNDGIVAKILMAR